MLKDKVKQLLTNSHFNDNNNYPKVVVLRNTNKKGEFLEDQGNNNCDTVVLVDSSNEPILLTGRSLPHEKYQDLYHKDRLRCNFICPGGYKQAWVRGYHRGKEALVQYRTFAIIRSKDKELRNDEDWLETNRLVADNCHGLSPFSAGCVTVVGNMVKPSDDWKILHNWAYETHKKRNFFSAYIFEHTMLEDCDKPHIMLGSSADNVKELQKDLGLKEDGIYGQITLKTYIDKKGDLLKANYGRIAL